MPAGIRTGNFWRRIRSRFPSVRADAEENENISLEDLRYMHILHYNFDAEVTEGELICNKAIADDLLEIFYELYLSEYKIEKVRLIDEYGPAVPAGEVSGSGPAAAGSVSGTEGISCVEDISGAAAVSKTEALMKEYIKPLAILFGIIFISSAMMHLLSHSETFQTYYKYV